MQQVFYELASQLTSQSFSVHTLHALKQILFRSALTTADTAAGQDSKLRSNANGSDDGTDTDAFLVVSFLLEVFLRAPHQGFDDGLGAGHARAPTEQRTMHAKQGDAVMHWLADCLLEVGPREGLPVGNRMRERACV